MNFRAIHAERKLPLCRTMCGVIGNGCVRMCVEREKVAAGCEGLAFVAILYTGVKDNEYGLSLAQRRALFVGIMNSIDRGCNPLA